MINIYIFEAKSNQDILMENTKINDHSKNGKLKIFFSYAQGVGKTYAMLDDANERFKSGVDVVIGYVKLYDASEDMQVFNNIPILSKKMIGYENGDLEEFDLDEALNRNPELIIVDELAHTNVKGARNKKRYQDIEELLRAGIDVYTTVNVENIESLNDIIYKITKITIEETVPDYVFDNADKVEFIDIDPSELLRRFQEDEAYIKKIFTKENLKLLREIAMRKATDRISHENQNEKELYNSTYNLKLLACIGPFSSSAKCIREAARMAEAFHVPWIVIYVNNMKNKNLSEEQNKILRSNFDLAEKLGAEVIVLNGVDVAETIAQYAKLSGITNIIIGKNRNRGFFEKLFKPDFADKLISTLKDVEIYIVSSDFYKKTTPKISDMLTFVGNFNLSLMDTIKTIFILIIATLMSILFQKMNIVGDQNIIMIYILSVLVVSRVTKGYFYGVLSSIITVLTFNFFFTDPYYTFNTINAAYPITFIIMLLVALIMSTVTMQIKNQVKIATERQKDTEILYEINKRLVITRSLENIVELTNEYIIKLFHCSVIFYTIDKELKEYSTFTQCSEDDDGSFMNKDNERIVAHWVFVNQKVAGNGTDTFTDAKAYYIPMISKGKVLGVLGVSCIKREFKHKDQLFIRMITAQVAMALERQYLFDEQQDIIVRSEKDKMRSNLLRTISHDLKVSLNDILETSSAILENKDKKHQKELISSIKDDSKWLIHLLESALSVTRVNKDNLNIIKTFESAQRVAIEAVDRIKKRFPCRNIDIKAPDDPLMLPMDGILISQVLINLIENSIKHSKDDTLIQLNIKKMYSVAQFEVVDSGEGINEKDLYYVFGDYESNGENEEDSLFKVSGLTVCNSIIKAHNGKLEASNRRAGGTIFSFTLPLN